MSDEALFREWMGWDATSLPGYVELQIMFSQPSVWISVLRGREREHAHIMGIDGYEHTMFSKWTEYHLFRIPDSALDSFRRYANRLSCNSRQTS